MPSWDSQQYLRFTQERTQPSIDLLARIGLAAPRRIVDLGCGPGNSTAVVGRRWASAELTGIDNSSAMVELPEFYYDALAPLAARIELWLTDYVHILDGPEAIVAWYRGTGLRPYLDLLPDDATREEYLRDYLTALTPHCPRQVDGRVLMPFRRLFVVVYR